MEPPPQPPDTADTAVPRDAPNSWQRFEERKRCKRLGIQHPSWADKQEHGGGPSRVPPVPRDAPSSAPRSDQRWRERERCRELGIPHQPWADEQLRTRQSAAQKREAQARYRAEQREAKGREPVVPVTDEEVPLAPQLASRAIAAAKAEFSDFALLWL